MNSRSQKKSSKILTSFLPSPTQNHLSLTLPPSYLLSAYVTSLRPYYVSLTLLRPLLLLRAYWWPLDAPTYFVEAVYLLYYYLALCLKILVDVFCGYYYLSVCSCLPTASCHVFPRYQAHHWFHCSKHFLATTVKLNGIIFFGPNPFISSSVQKRSWCRGKGGECGCGRGRDSGGGHWSGDKDPHHCAQYSKNNHTTDKYWDKFGKTE